MDRSRFGILVLLPWLWTASAADAATANATLTVQATVADTCGVADGSLNFGAVDPSTGVTVAINASFNVTCSLGTAFSVGLSDGMYGSGGARRMRRGATTDYLTYDLYKDVLLTTRFGDTGASDRVAGVGLGVTATPIAIYGAIPSSQAGGAGAYADTVQVTLYY